MHSCEIGNTRFQYNSDLSGDVIVITNVGSVGETSTRVPGKDLLGFLAEHIRLARIIHLEEASQEELLGYPVCNK